MIKLHPINQEGRQLFRESIERRGGRWLPDCLVSLDRLLLLDCEGLAYLDSPCMKEISKVTQSWGLSVQELETGTP